MNLQFMGSLETASKRVLHAVLFEKRIFIFIKDRAGCPVSETLRRSRGLEYAMPPNMSQKGGLGVMLCLHDYREQCNAASFDSPYASTFASVKIRETHINEGPET